MKFSLRLLAFALGTGLAFAAPTAARAQVSVGANIGIPPWGPPVQQATQYYYIPEIDGYYDIYNGVYIVFDGQQWLQVPYLDGYDPYYFHPVPVVSYRGPQPWLYINSYRQRYPQYVTVYRGGGYGAGGRYYGHEYGAGRVYGYDRGGYGNRGGYDRDERGAYRGDHDNRGGGYGGNRGGYDNDRSQRGSYATPQGRVEGSRSDPPDYGGQGQPGRQPNYGGQGQPQPGGQPNYGGQGQRGGGYPGGGGQRGGDGGEQRDGGGRRGDGGQRGDGGRRGR